MTDSGGGPRTGPHGDQWADDDPLEVWSDEPHEAVDDDAYEPVEGFEADVAAPVLADVDPVDVGGTWVEWKQPAGRRRRWLIGLVAVLSILILVAGGTFVWLQRQIDPPGSAGADIEVEIERGSTTEAIGRQLDESGVISNASVWNYYTRLKDEGPFQAGRYIFQLDSSFTEAIAVLEAGPLPPKAARITIPEGLTVAATLERISDPTLGIAGFTLDKLEAAISSGLVRSQFQPADSTSVEGLLFPETYEVGEKSDEQAFLQRLVSQLDQTLIRLGVVERAAALGVTPYDIIKIASLIEEEARVDGDRAKIARVIYNRLEQGIPLGIDATSRYEAEIAGRGRDSLDFSSDSPYNTRRVRGLPPTPIASAGTSSIEAALEPEDGDWIFYVLKNPTEHFFTPSSAEFQRAKAECARNNLGCG